MACFRKPRKRTNSEEQLHEERCRRVARVNGRLIGLEGDADLAFLLKGGELMKVRSGSWQKQRFYQLQEDCKTLWHTSQKPFRKSHTFSLDDVESVRAGRGSEGLLKHMQPSTDERCFCIVFKGRRKTLDLVASSDTEASRWAVGLQKVLSNMQGLSQHQQRQHWIFNCMRKADKNMDNRMSLKELKHFLRQINIEVDDTYAAELFKKCDESNSGTLEGAEIKHFYDLLTSREEIDVIFARYVQTAGQMSDRDLLRFLQEEQHEAASLQHANALIQKYELDDAAKQKNHMTKDGFLMFLHNEEGSILNPAHKGVYQDMTQPLNHYLISSSHNTYLLEDQLKGPSSTEAYVRALMKGCRCVELDCWDGAKGEPVIYHGHTLTSRVLFKDVITAIKEYAFKVSEYPVILSLENHCSVEQQALMARHLSSILGSALLTKPLGHHVPTRFPSPADLKGRFLIKAKRLDRLDAALSSLVEDSVSEEDEAAEAKESEPKPKPKKAKMKLARELSDMVVYCRSVHFSGFQHARDTQVFYEMSSFKESKALTLAENSASAFIQHNTEKLSRIYPAGSRTDSSNYNPVPLWNTGCQIVALNFQTPCKEMDLNQGCFLPNGRSGYILKPEFQRVPGSVFDPSRLGNGPWLQKKTLHVMVISAQQLPKLNKNKNKSIVDPLVRVEIYGVPADKSSKETRHMLNNGFNPMWNERFQFSVHVPALALVRFVVEDYDAASTNDFIGQYTIPLNSMQNGYRHVPLLTKNGDVITSAGLFVHIMALDAK